jgi:hypothetical protein
MIEKTLAEQYAAIQTRAKLRAEKEGCEFYIAAVLGVKNSGPYIKGFVIADFYDSAVLCRVSATMTTEI